jgi:hypothetical protein
MLEVLVVLLVIGIAFLVRRSKTGTTTSVGGGVVGGFSNALKPLLKNGWVRPVVTTGAVALLWWWWDEVKSTIASWFPATDMGQWIGVSQAFVQSWLWLPAVLGCAWAILRIFTPAGTAGSGFTTIGKMVSDTWDAILMLFVASGFVLPIVAGALVVAAIVGNATGATDAIIKWSTVRGEVCTTAKDLKPRIDAAGKDIVICPEEGMLYLFAEGNRRLVFDFSPKFKRDNEHLLEGRSLGDFVQIQAPGTFPGSIVGSWRVAPLRTIPDTEFVSTWDKSGLKQIIVTVKAVP